MKYIPHDYQSYATEFILSHPVAAILLQMGLGKSVITLMAIRELLDRGEVKKVLVIAPLRVARDTWPEELRKWDHLWGITWAVAVGSAEERMAALRQSAQITMINRENVPWLVEASALQRGECLPFPHPAAQRPRDPHRRLDLEPGREEGRACKRKVRHDPAGRYRTVKE